MQIVQKRKIFFAISAMLVLVSLLTVSLWKLKLGIDFTDGVLMEVAFSGDKPSVDEVKNTLAEFNLGEVLVQPTGENSYQIRYVSKEDAVNEQVQSKIKEVYVNGTIDRVEFTTTSQELKGKALQAIFMAAVGITLYIAVAFRKVSYPVASWKYGMAAIVALLHDIIITVGVFSFLGKFYGVEVNIPFIAALLTILGYSVNDTIVVFDRVRENLLRAGSKDDFENTVNKSLNETLLRSFNTSVTVMIVLLVIFFLGGESIRYFALALFTGVFFGTYSSIFIASALLVEIWHWQIKKA
jgi:preprotein translocase subunit SecF